MNLSQQLAKHFKEVFFGGNWTWVNLKDTLVDVSFAMARTRVHDLNTISALVFHINYYVRAVSGVIQGKPLEAKDKFSFDVPPIESKTDWEDMVSKTLEDGM